MFLNSMSLASTAIYNGQTVTYTWIPAADIEHYAPVTQAYGVCINDEGKVLLIKDKHWQIPGGTPEKGETLEETLKRELVEEAQVELGKIIPLGVQEVRFPNNPDKEQGELFYQARYVAIISKTDQPKPDPDTGREYERKFASFDEANDLVQWGELGSQVFRDAKSLYETL